MLIQEYLSSESLQSLIDNYGIKARIYKDDNLVILNYDQEDSPRFNPIVDECRALILELGTWNVINKSFSRFYDYKDVQQSFDLDKSTAFTKIDGSLMSCYNYKKRWNVASRSTAFAEKSSANGFVYRNIFDDAFNINALKRYSTDWCFSFELVSPKARVKKKYLLTEVYLLSIFDRKSEKELFQAQVNEIAQELRVARPEICIFDGSIFDSFKSLEEFDEGYVCVIEDENGIRRVKVRNPSYLAVSYLKGPDGRLNPRKMCWLLVNDDQDGYLSDFPDDKVLFEPFEEAYNDFLEELQHSWKVASLIDDQKDFAFRIKDLDFSSVLFAKRKNPGILLSDILLQVRVETLTEWLKRRLK